MIWICDHAGVDVTLPARFVKVTKQEWLSFINNFLKTEVESSVFLPLS